MNIFTDSPFKLFLKFLIPSISAMLGLSLYILFDTIFIGQGVGVDGLTALNISLPIFSMFISLGMMIGIGGAAAFSVNIGKSELKKAQEIFTVSIYLAIIFSVLFVTICIIFIDKLLLFLGASKNVYVMVKSYSFILIVFSPAFIFLSVLSNFVRNDHAPKLAMIAGLSGNFANIILDWVFIFIFHWGMVGAALATVISPIVSIIIIIKHFKNPACRLRFVNPFYLLDKRLNISQFKRFFDFYIKPYLEICIRIIKNGLPGLLDGVAPGLVVLGFNKVLISIQGDIAVAGYSIIANIAFVGIVLFGGTAQAVQPLVSQNFGASKISRLKLFFQYSVYTGLIFAFVKISMIFLYSKEIIFIFNKDNSELFTLASNGIKIYFLAMPFMAFNVITVTFFQAIESSKIAFFLTINRTVIFVLVGLFVLPFYFAITGVWLVVPVAEFVIFICSLIFLLRKFNKL